MTSPAGAPGGTSKVFGIGLNKTGTSSLHEALLLLGLRSLHWGGPATRALVRQALDEGRRMLDLIDPEPDAVSDLEEVTFGFATADEHYPAARFILTVRDLEPWIDSRRRHVEKNRERAAAGEYQGSFLAVDPDAWVDEYRTHEAEVRSHFADRPGDLLVFDLTAGDGWERLCPFLGVPVPTAPFPWKNRYQPFRTGS